MQEAVLSYPHDTLWSAVGRVGDAARLSIVGHADALATGRMHAQWRRGRDYWQARKGGALCDAKEAA